MNILESIFMTETGEAILSFDSFIIATIASLLIGYVIAKSATYKQTSSKNFIITVAMLPAIVQLIIMIVNGNIGTGIAVMGTFSLVRFRSLQGNASEIMYIFMGMAVGLATGTGYIGYAFLFIAVILGAHHFYRTIGFKEQDLDQKKIKITIPEDLYEDNLFDELLSVYTKEYQLQEIKTTSMGSLFKLVYIGTLKDNRLAKELIDNIRLRNGNLEVSVAKNIIRKNEL
jgi:hypothetical protein